MSYGDPNQPYGPPPPVGQPSPHQAPYGVPQYGTPGYPAGGPGPYQQPTPGAHPAPPVPTTMPSAVSSARVMLFVIAGLQVIGIAVFVWGAAFVNSKRHEAAYVDDYDFQKLADISSSILWVLIAVAATWGIGSLVLGAQLASGGSGLRTATIVFAVTTAVVGLSTFPLGIVHLVLGIVITVFLSRPESELWFKRHRVR